MSILTGKGQTHTHPHACAHMHTHTHTHVHTETRKAFASVLSPVAVIIEVDSVRSGTDKQLQQHKQVSQQRLITTRLVLLLQLSQNTQYAAHCCFFFYPSISCLLNNEPE